MKYSPAIWLVGLIVSAAYPQSAGAADGPLTRAEVQRLIVGKRIVHYDEDTQMSLSFSPDGTFVSAAKGAPGTQSGRYRIEKDGRVCWSALFKGCFRYYRSGQAVRVRREDAKSHADIGIVRSDP
jgi:hypothetical protein